MMGWWVMLAKVIAQICFSWCPIDAELALFGAVFYPIEMHVHCSGALLFDCVIDNAAGCGIINLYWCGVLFVAKFFFNVVQITAPALQLRNRLATSASAADDMMFLIIAAMVCSAPLLISGLSGLFPR
jgi:hypothetical protein